MAPPGWPHYDVIAQPKGLTEPLRISVKSRTFKKGAAFVTYNQTDVFDWLAIVLLGCEPLLARRYFIVPRAIADQRARKDGPEAKTNECYWRIDEIAQKLQEFENNFCLLVNPTQSI